MSDADRLLSIASAIADGTGVVWSEEAKRPSTSNEVATLNALRELEQLLTALRQTDREEEPTPATAIPDMSAVSSTPHHWGHLAILGTIGKGSFGTVYRAHDARLGVDVALKLLSPSRSGRHADRILREAQLLARVRHPNVVRVYGVDDSAEPMGLWMELLEGSTLRELLKTNGPFSAQEASIIGRELCRAMAAVHQAGILHGDIKAHNVMRESGGRIVLMDFGAGQTLDDESVESSGPVAGTPVYLAPEVLNGGPRTASSDIYALGVLLYYLVTKGYPVSGHSVAALADAHRRGERRHLRDARPDLPDDFVRAVEQAIAPDPRLRFASLGQFEDALSRLPYPSGVRPHAHAQRTWPVLQGRWRLGLAAAITVAIVSVGGFVLGFRNSSPRVASGPPTLSAAPVVEREVSSLYDIEAAFYRAGRSGEERLVSDARVAPGDELFLKLQASVPLHVYVVDEDEKGAAFLLFPLRGERLTNPLPAGQAVVVPGASRWQVTSAGEREHFIVFASPEPLDSLEEAFARLPAPRAGAPVGAAALPSATVQRLRGVGGLAPAPETQSSDAGLSRLFTLPLGDTPERARGLWVRQLTVANPGK
jgi:serine/threonine-protein kinase